MKTAEQMVRDILEQAIKDRLVKPMYKGGTPQDISAGDLVGAANILNAWVEEITDRFV